MKYKCIRGVVTSKGSINPGDVVELSASEANTLMAYGKIVPHHEVVTHREEEITTNVVEDVVHRDPTPRRGRPSKNRY